MSFNCYMPGSSMPGPSIEGSTFQSALQSSLLLISPSGFKSGTGVVQVNPQYVSNWYLQDIKEKLKKPSCGLWMHADILDPKLQDDKCLEITQVIQGYLALDLDLIGSQGSNFQFPICFEICLNPHSKPEQVLFKPIPQQIKFAKMTVIWL